MASLHYIMRTFLVALPIIFLTASAKATLSEVFSYKVTKAQINKDYSASLEIVGNSSCSSIVLDPGQITSEDVEHRTIPLNVLGMNCLNSSEVKTFELKVTDVRDHFFNFLKDKKGKWLLEFRENNQSHLSDLKRFIIL